VEENNGLPKRQMKMSSVFSDLMLLHAAHSSILISRRFTLHARSWPNAASCRTFIDLDLTPLHAARSILTSRHFMPHAQS